MSNIIRDLRVQTGMNRREFSIELGIPYMTLTDWELGKHEPPKYVLRLLQYYTRINNMDNMDSFLFGNKDECHVWADQQNYQTEFPVVCNHKIVPVNNIYPLKQHDAVAIHEAVKDDSRVTNIILFGSSVNMRCRRESDLDLSVRLYPEYCDNSTKNEVSEVIQEACNWNADIIWFDRLNKGERLYNNILKGVQIL